MGGSVGRIGGNLSLANSQVSASKTPTGGANNLHDAPTSFLSLIAVESANSPSIHHLTGSFPVLNREARMRVFEKICEDTFLNPQHPYYSIGAAHREELKSWVLAALRDSHYFHTFPESPRG